jgi:hypothetical protein
VAYQPPSTHPVFYGGSQVNTSSWASDGLGVHLSALEGWEGGVEFEDNRESRPGTDGERARSGKMRGRELVVAGRVCGSSWADLQSRKRTLAGVFAPSSAEKLFKVPVPEAAWTPDDADGVPGDYAVTLDGSTQYGTVPYAAALNPSVFTVEAWVKTSTTGATQIIVDNRSAGTAGWLLNLSSAGVPQFQFGGSSTLNAGVSVADGVFHHLVGSFNGTNARLYVDGDLIAGPTSTTLTPNSGTDPRVGARSHTSPTLPFPGEIDEVAIYSSALSATRIQAHHVAGRGEAGNFVEEIQQDSPVAWYRMHDGDAPSVMADSSGNGYNGTWTGSPTLDAPQDGPPAYAESGMPDYERVMARVVEPIRFEEAEGPLVQAFAVALRASDPRIYSDAVTTTADTVVADDQWSASVANTGTVATPCSIQMASADASEFTWRVAAGGATISSGTLDTGVDLVSPGQFTVDGDERDVRVTLPSVADIVSQSAATVHAYYRFDDASGNPQDSSGNGYHLTASGTFVDAYQVPSLFDGDTNTALRLTSANAGEVAITGGALGTSLTTASWTCIMAFQRNTNCKNVTLLRFDDGAAGFRIRFGSNGSMHLFRVGTSSKLPETVAITAGRRYLLVLDVPLTGTSGSLPRVKLYDAATGAPVAELGGSANITRPTAASTVFGPSSSGSGVGTFVIDGMVIAEGDASASGPAYLLDAFRAGMFSGDGTSSFGNLAGLNGWPILDPGTNTVTIEAGDTATTGTMTVTHRNARV